MGKKTLECSSRGDRRFSALYAEVEVFGEKGTIESFYQLSKRFKGKPAPKDWKEAKGKQPDTIVIGKTEISGKYLTAWYYLLWYKYLKAHPELVEEASKYDDFSDMFAKGAINSQADVIRDYIKRGPEFIMNMPDVKLLKVELKYGGLAGRGKNMPRGL